MGMISYEDTRGRADYDAWKAAEAAYEHDLMNHVKQFPSGCPDFRDGVKCGYCQEYGSRLFENSQEK